MPRKPHRHGGAVHVRGISSLKACVICGANDAGDELCRVADRGRPKDEALRDAIKGLGPGAWVATDAHQGCRRVLPALGITEHAATGTRLQKDGELGMASAMHQRLRIVLAPIPRRIHQAAGPLPLPVPLARAGKALGRRRASDAFRPERLRLLRACEAPDDRSSPALLGLLATAGSGYVNAGLTESNLLTPMVKCLQ